MNGGRPGGEDCEAAISPVDCANVAVSGRPTRDVDNRHRARLLPGGRAGSEWDALRSGRVNIDLEKYAPWMIHPLAPLNLDSQIPKKGDQRQMEAWQRIGTYAAGLALDSAGIKDDKEILARTDMIVAAGGGERDLDVDAAILTARADARSGALNERLMNDLRPTLFLAQLSNLLAGNISIVHGVSGSSRTFM